ncbi:MAG: 2-hydroxychromene-2-carboxylate isomerase [Labilithrix sp.]|nr:2-hydroxychromene-2-carboxylate isomerase [Labilithrix sp.]
MSAPNANPNLPKMIEAGRSYPPRSLDFWFDYTCPFAYLASTQAPALAERMGVPLIHRPLLLGGVFKAVGTPQNLFATRSAARTAHEANDMARWAKRFGVELRMPMGHPMRSVEALRATLATSIDPAVVAGFYRAYWVENRPISSREVITEVVSRAGHDADAILAKIETTAIKDDLRRRTEEAVALGIFGVPAWVVDGAHLYWGQDRITFVEGVRPPASTAPTSSTTNPRTLDVYWDFSSPFAYLGIAQVEALARRTGAKVVSHPILLGGLFRSIGTPDVPLATFSAAKQQYTMTDLHRWASFWTLPFRFPSRFPTNSIKALRVYLALASDEHRTRFRDATFRAYWAEDRDITDEQVLIDCVGDEALAREALLRAGSDEVKATLRKSTEDAAARGVFGVPTFGVGDDLFWGQDRLTLVEDALIAR